MRNKTTGWIRGYADGRKGKPIDPKRYGSSRGTSTQLQEIDYKIGHEAGASQYTKEFMASAALEFSRGRG